MHTEEENVNAEWLTQQDFSVKHLIYDFLLSILGGML